jgi:hypothetical protein
VKRYLFSLRKPHSLAVDSLAIILRESTLHEVKRSKNNHRFLLFPWHIVLRLRGGKREQCDLYCGTHLYYYRIPIDQKEAKGIHKEKTIIAAQLFDLAGA